MKSYKQLFKKLFSFCHTAHYSKPSILFLPTLALYLLSFTFCFSSCNTIDLYEKAAAIPGHAWKSSFKPSFTFTIKDTTTNYDVYLILRHTDKYSFNNIFLSLSLKTPAGDTLKKAAQTFTLATDDKGWLGSGMDDIFEHRILMSANEPFKKGEYTFMLEQIMQQDPLNNVLNAGIRIEKSKK